MFSSRRRNPNGQQSRSSHSSRYLISIRWLGAPSSFLAPSKPLDCSAFRLSPRRNLDVLLCHSRSPSNLTMFEGKSLFWDPHPTSTSWIWVEHQNLSFEASKFAWLPCLATNFCNFCCKLSVGSTLW